jgi:CDP-diacylglycerol--glycerol-3-phosphate 3-phosphatidyltransferase
MIPIGRIPAWIVAVTIIRDLIVDVIRSIASSEGNYIQASPIGKQKTLAQTIAITALMIHYSIFGIDAHVVGTITLYIALLFTIYSGVDYFIKFYQTLVQKDNFDIKK